MLKKIIFVLLIIGIFLNNSMAEEKVFSVTVKRVMGERDSRDEIREIATLEAKRQALEQAGTYLETETVMREYKLAKDEVIAMTAGVTSTRVVDETWAMEGGHFVIILTYEINIDTDDVEDRIKALRNDRQKMDEHKRLQAENSRLLAEMEKLKKQLETANKNEIAGHKKVRKQLSDELMAAEWLEKGLSSLEYDDEIECYTNAIELNPNIADTYNYRGEAYFHKNDYDSAIADFTRALAIDSKYTNAYYIRGIIYYVQRRYELAIADYTKAIQIKPTDSLFFWRGVAYKNKGDKFNARKDFQKALDLGYKHAQVELDKLK